MIVNDKNLPVKIIINNNLMYVIFCMINTIFPDFLKKSLLNVLLRRIGIQQNF